MIKLESVVSTRLSFTHTSIRSMGETCICALVFRRSRTVSYSSNGIIDVRRVLHPSVHGVPPSFPPGLSPGITSCSKTFKSPHATCWTISDERRVVPLKQERNAGRRMGIVHIQFRIAICYTQNDPGKRSVPARQQNLLLDVIRPAMISVWLCLSPQATR